MMRFEYVCPTCEAEMAGTFNAPVYCTSCDVTFETDWDYGRMKAWLVGEPRAGDVRGHLALTQMITPFLQLYDYFQKHPSGAPQVRPDQGTTE